MVDLYVLVVGIELGAKPDNSALENRPGLLRKGAESSPCWSQAHQSSPFHRITSLASIPEPIAPVR